jgi:hypothetical protein
LSAFYGQPPVVENGAINLIIIVENAEKTRRYVRVTRAEIDNRPARSSTDEPDPPGSLYLVP